MNDRAGDPQGRASLHQAAVHGDAGLVGLLIAEGADPAAADIALATPLHMACQQGHVEVAWLLLDAGAPVEARDSFGKTPLARAVFSFQGGEPELIRLLLAAGADPDTKSDSGQSPRDIALRFDRPGIRAVFP
jgi:uncharacterized protein